MKIENKKLFITNLEVRGYELDSFGHVNNAVYLNYLEQARWEMAKEIGLLEEMKKSDTFLVVTSLSLKFIRELKLFDTIQVQTVFTGTHQPFLPFRQKILNETTGFMSCSGMVEMLLIDKERIACECPGYILERLRKE